jgi:hypothetical protein
MTHSEVKVWATLGGCQMLENVGCHRHDVEHVLNLYSPTCRIIVSKLSSQFVKSLEVSIVSFGEVRYRTFEQLRFLDSI